MKKCVLILFGFEYLCLAVFSLSYSGLVKDIPALMGFLIISIVPLSALALPIAVICSIAVLFVTVKRLIKKEKIITGNYYMLLAYLILSLGFFIAVIAMNNWKLIPVKI
jgi:hypothetical protein